MSMMPALLPSGTPPPTSDSVSTLLPVPPAPNEDVPLVSGDSDHRWHFDYRGFDIVLRSCDSHDFRVPQLYLANSSFVLRTLIRDVLNTSDVANREEQEPLPVIKLPESGEILYSLLTFIFPVSPHLPFSTENIMKLLAAAQKYQMCSVLKHARASIYQDDHSFILPEEALYIYFLAQQHGLHKEMLQAARSTLRLSMTIEDLENKIHFMPGAYIRELWKYHERIRKDLVPSLLEFRKLGPHGVKGLRCRSTDDIPQWLGDYIESLAEAPHLLGIIEFENVRARHIKAPQCSTCTCAGISNESIRVFWDALTSVVNGVIEEADSTLALMKEEPISEKSDPPPVPARLNVPDADIILRSSEQVNFRVRTSLLAMSSPFFEDLLSLPQPPKGELLDGLPVVQLSEDAGLLISLISFLYPISPVRPSTYEKVFALLAACQKYDMESIQSHIRAEIKRGTFPAPVGTEAFRGYAIASSMGLIPEKESAARLTLAYPMTFESLGEELQSFSGQTLCDLIRYRKRCRDSLRSCLGTFFNVRPRCKIWESCEKGPPTGTDAPTTWLHKFLATRSKRVELNKGFTQAIRLPSINLEKKYLAALKSHTQTGCSTCARVHMEVPAFYRELEDMMERALNGVC